MHLQIEEKYAIITVGITVKLSKKASIFENPLYIRSEYDTENTPITILSAAIKIDIPIVHFAPSITKCKRSYPFRSVPSKIGMKVKTVALVDFHPHHIAM